MKKPMLSKSDLKFCPLTSQKWKDFEELFGERGACGGCWCMSWRIPKPQFKEQKGQKNKLAMKRIVNSGRVPGILAFHKDKPIGWCSIGPREEFPTLKRSRIVKAMIEKDLLENRNDKSIWSIVCLFIAKSNRNQGISIKMLKAAADYAKKKGAKIVEGYPKDTRKSRWADAFVWTGHISAFKKAGFVETYRSSPTQVIMRYF